LNTRSPSFVDCQSAEELPPPAFQSPPCKARAVCRAICTHAEARHESAENSESRYRRRRKQDRFFPMGPIPAASSASSSSSIPALAPPSHLDHLSGVLKALNEQSLHCSAELLVRLARWQCSYFPTIDVHEHVGLVYHIVADMFCRDAGALRRRPPRQRRVQASKGLLPPGIAAFRAQIQLGLMPHGELPLKLVGSSRPEVSTWIVRRFEAGQERCSAAWPFRRTHSPMSPCAASLWPVYLRLNHSLFNCFFRPRLSTRSRNACYS
jgi:hypothetical protein